MEETLLANKHTDETLLLAGGMEKRKTGNAVQNFLRGEYSILFTGWFPGNLWRHCPVQHFPAHGRHFTKQNSVEEILFLKGLGEV